MWVIPGRILESSFEAVSDAGGWFGVRGPKKTSPASEKSRGSFWQKADRVLGGDLEKRN